MMYTPLIILTPFIIKADLFEIVSVIKYIYIVLKLHSVQLQKYLSLGNKK